jgi:hypothetical protein
MDIYSTLHSEIFAAVDRRADHNIILCACFCALSLQRYAVHACHKLVVSKLISAVEYEARELQ